MFLSTTNRNKPERWEFLGEWENYTVIENVYLLVFRIPSRLSGTQKKKVGCDQLIKLGWICFYPSLFFVLVYMRKFTWQTHHRTMSVWRTCGDNSLPDLLMARGVGSATGASWSGTIFASSSTLAPPARLHRTTLAATSCYYTFRIEPRPVCCSFSYCSFLSGRQTQISS